MKTKMAGDRGLAFVVVGLIGVSAFFISNHGRIALGHSTVHAAGIVSSPIPASGSSIADFVSAGTPSSLNADADGLYTFHARHAVLKENAVTGSYPELTGSAAEPLPRIRQRLRLSQDFGLTPPLY